MGYFKMLQGKILKTFYFAKQQRINNVITMMMVMTMYFITEM